MKRKRTALFVGVLSVLAVAAALAFPFFGYTTNCGGNSAALSRVQEYALVASMTASDNLEHTFRVNAVTPDLRKQLAELAHCRWIPNARFLVATAPLYTNESRSRRVIIVCDTPYRNVPRRWMGSAPPAHAAGFSDGSAALISPAEFAALDRSSFTYLDEIYPPK